MYVRCITQLLLDDATIIIEAFETEATETSYFPVLECSLQDLIYNPDMMEFHPQFGVGGVSLATGLAFCPCEKLEYGTSERQRVRLNATALDADIGNELVVPSSTLVKRAPLLVHPREELMERLIRLLAYTGDTDEERQEAVNEYLDQLFSAIPLKLADRIKAGTS